MSLHVDWPMASTIPRLPWPECHGARRIQPAKCQRDNARPSDRSRPPGPVPTLHPPHLRQRDIMKFYGLPHLNKTQAFINSVPFQST
jgi:hypothetical protein